MTTTGSQGSTWTKSPVTSWLFSEFIRTTSARNRRAEYRVLCALGIAGYAARNWVVEHRDVRLSSRNTAETRKSSPEMPLVENGSKAGHVTTHSVKRRQDVGEFLLSLNRCTSIWSAQRSARRQYSRGPSCGCASCARRCPTRRRCVERTTLRSPRAAVSLQVCEAHVEMPTMSRPTTES